MMISERVQADLDLLDSLKKQVEFLDSHKNVGLINEKQHRESLLHIIEQIEYKEDEYGIIPEGINGKLEKIERILERSHFVLNNLLKRSENALDEIFTESREAFDKMFDYKVHKEIEQIDRERE